MESPTKKRKAGKTKSKEEDKEIISSESSLKSKGDNSSKKYSPSIHKKRASKAEEKKLKRERMRLERLTIKDAARISHSIPRPKRGEMPPTFSINRGDMKSDLVLKKTGKSEVKNMLKEIKKARSTRHIAFTKTIKELGAENVEIYKRYERTLDDEIPSKGLDLPIVAKYLYGILDGVASFHKAGYIHGDLKPNNIAVSSGVAKLIDYTESYKGKKLGTSTANRYYAPTCMLYPQACDLFAVGSIFVEMMFGLPLKKEEYEPTDIAVKRTKKKISSKYGKEEREMILDLLGSLLDLEKKDEEGKPRVEKLLKHKFFELRYKVHTSEDKEARKTKKAKKARKTKAMREKRQKAKENKKKLS
jgi:serine/threonine protein kinase